MPGAFGQQTVTCISYTQGTAGDLGAGVLTPTRTDVPGCRHRPLPPGAVAGGGLARAEEATEIGLSVATIWWQTTAPPVAAILALKASDAIEVDGQIYRIIAGPHPFTNLAGKLVKVTLISEKQTIGA